MGEPDRDYTGEMASLVSEICHRDGDITPTVEAANLVDKLKQTDQDLLFGWLVQHASSILTDQIRGVLRSVRMTARSRADSTAFAVSAHKFSAGDKTAMGRWLDVRYVIDSNNTQRRLADMTKNDLLFVANRYTNTAKTQLMEAAFHRALANRLGNRCVSDVFSEEEIDRMYRGISGSATMNPQSA